MIFFIILLVKKNNRVSKKTLRQVRKHIKHVKIRKQKHQKSILKHNTHKSMIIYFYILFYHVLYNQTK
jgi:hypothetical protein